MSNVISLRRARKAKARADAEAEAAANRAAFGRTKAERAASKAEQLLADKRLAAHKLEPDA